MAISNESSCHKEFKVVNITPVPDQGKKSKILGGWGFGGLLVPVGFFLVCQTVKGKNQF